MIQVRDRALTRFVEHPLAVVDLGLQPRGSSVASSDGIVKFSLGVREKLIGRSGFGSGTGYAGDSGLRTRRSGMVFAACDDQGLVAVCTGRVDGLVERDACLAHLLQVGRLLDNGRRRNGVARGLLLNHAVNRAGEQRERREFADDPTQGHHQDHGHRRRSASGSTARRPGRDRPGRRAHQQGEYQGERHHDRRRHVHRRHDSEGRHQPRQYDIDQHNHAGDRVCGPLVTFVEFKAVAATQPGEPGHYRRAWGSWFSNLMRAHRSQVPPESAQKGHGRGYRISEWVCGAVHIRNRIAHTGSHRCDGWILSQLPPRRHLARCISAFRLQRARNGAHYASRFRRCQ